MRLRAGLLLWLHALLYVSALEESEAGVIDWHKELVGVPLTDSTQTLPSFIRSDVKSPVKKTGVAVATKSNVLAVINPGSTGNIVWRREFDKSEGRILQYKTHRDALITLSGPGGSHVRLFESFTGNLLWERQLHPNSLGRLLEPPSLGVDVTFWDDVRDIDAYVLTNGHTVSRLEGRSGKTVWSWTTDDIGTLVSRVILSETSIYALGLTKTDTYALTLTIIDRESGTLTSQTQIPSRITRGMRDVFVLSTRDTQTPAIAWFEKSTGTLHSAVLSEGKEIEPQVLSTKLTFARVHDVQLGSKGLFVAETKDNLPYVFGMNDNGLVQEWDFDDSAVSKSETPSLFSGSTDRDGNPYIARVFWSLSTGLAHLHAYAAHGSEGKGISTGSTFPFDTAEHGVILHCAMDAFMPHQYNIQYRMVLTTSTGAVQLWQNQDLHWTRDEALADIALATLVDLPERKIADELGASEHRGFAERLQAHIVAAQNLPQYIAQFTKRFATGSYTSATSPSASSALERDAFGFRKLLVVATNHGTLIGVDTAQGTVVWRKIVGISSPSSPDVSPFKMMLVKSALEGPVPEVVLVADRKIRGKKTKTSVVFHFEALTGRWIGQGHAMGHKVSDVEVAEAFLVPGSNGVVGVISADGKISLYPTSAAKSTLDHTSNLYFTRQIGSELRGYTLDPSLETPAVETWKKSFITPASFPNAAASSLELIHRPSSPIASYGKVLGDRTTLYKYLSPHAAVVLAPDNAVRVLDLVSGAIVFDSGALEERPSVAFAENWLVYAHEVVGNATDKGTRVVSVELYEGSGKDDKTRSVDASSFSESSSRVHAVQQSWLFPYPVVALGTTATKFGISTKGLLLATSKGQVYHLHRRMLDPRRPMQKPNAQEQEEMLIQYEPILPPDTRRIITHKNQVLGTTHLLAAPTLLESTSCVLAYGLDLFHSRVTPSGTFDLLGAGFNKMQLMLTIVGLSVAIVVVRPLVARKQLHAAWYN